MRYRQLAAAMLPLLIWSGTAQAGMEGEWLCVTSAISGIVYNGETRVWESQPVKIIHDTDDFTLRVKYREARDDGDVYDLHLRLKNKSSSSDCEDRYGDGAFTFKGETTFLCGEMIYGYYQINLNNGRFSKSAIGTAYMAGMDKPSPFGASTTSIGTCTRQ